jgi:hypothetical protein
MMRGDHCRCLCVIIFPGTLLTRTYELWYGRPHMTNSDQLWPPEYVISLSDNYIDSTLLPASYDIYVMWGGHCRCLCVIIWPGTLWTRTYELWYGRPHLTTSDHIWPRLTTWVLYQVTWQWHRSYSLTSLTSRSHYVGRPLPVSICQYSSLGHTHVHQWLGPYHWTWLVRVMSEWSDIPQLWDLSWQGFG